MGIGEMMQNVDLQYYRRVSFSRWKKSRTTQALLIPKQYSKNQYYLFLGMTYLMLNADSKFLQEFAFLWQHSDL